MRDTEEKVAANPSLHVQVEPLSEIGNDAFEVTSTNGLKLYVRKDDLVFFLSVPKYSRQTQPNSVAFGPTSGQALARWCWHGGGCYSHCRKQYCGRAAG
jgi:hypothetical protein